MLSGLEQAVLRNIAAVKGLTDLTRTSLGPNGMNKMIVNHLGKTFVTSDTATIIKELEVEHPAARLVVMAAQMQEVEVGDGSNLVVCLSGELLGAAEDLIRTGLHTADIVHGYAKAAEAAIKILDELTVWTVESKDMLNKDNLAKAVATAIASKQYGLESFLAPLVASACLVAMPKNPTAFNVENVRVCKVLGGNLYQSELVNGMVISHDPLGLIKKCKDAKIAVFTCSIQPTETETKGTVLINSADELMNYNLSEEKAMEKMIIQWADSGVNVVVSGGAVDDLALHYLEKYHIMVLKVLSQHELRRLCRAVGAGSLVGLGPVNPESLGYCSFVHVREVGSQMVTVFEQSSADATQISTILLRASTHHTLNDLERAVDDGVNVVKSIARDGRFVAGGGAVEIELARRLSLLGAKTRDLDQYAIAKFATAFEVVPRTLAENAGLPAIDLIGQLYAAHEKGESSAGINIDDGSLSDMTKHSVFDLLITKKHAIALAAEAVTTILRIDQIISAKPAGGPKLPKKDAHWDDD